MKSLLLVVLALCFIGCAVNEKRTITKYPDGRVVETIMKTESGIDLK